MTYTQEQLEQAFQKVQNKEHWKNPIDAFCRAEELEITREAINYFTATNTYFEQDQGNGWARIKAKGYYLGPAN